MIKGYLTIFLSLSLTVFSGIFLGLIGGVQQNLEKVYFECAVDIGMNATLGEFHREMLEQYDLLYIDISYGKGGGLINNMSEHLKTYLENNLSSSNPTAGNDLSLQEIMVSDYSLASDEDGMVMRRQACAYMRESGKEDYFEDLQAMTGIARELDKQDGMEIWGKVMRNIVGHSAASEPDNPEKEALVLADSPAGKIFLTAEEQLEKLCYPHQAAGSGVTILPDDYFSGRPGRPDGRISGNAEMVTNSDGISDRYLFRAYLFEKCGSFRAEKKDSLLAGQIEFLIFGMPSDRQNMAAAIRKIFNWRFADQLRLYLENHDKYEEALSVAEEWTAAAMKPELQESVIQSILCTWAFIDSIYDTNVIMQGGTVPLQKEEPGFSEQGLNYQQFLWLMLAVTDEKTVNRRTMDIMEMDIRQTAYNQNFQIDGCLENYRVKVTVANRRGGNYEIERRYGYY